MIAALWSGYNINEPFTDVIEVSVNAVVGIRITSSNQQTSAQLESDSLTVRLRDKLFLFLAALGLIASSALLLVYVNESQLSLRTIIAQSLGAPGIYLLIFSLGTWLGYRIPTHHHPLRLSICTYLLIPLATAELSVLHMIGLLGAGVYGGIATYVFDQTYQDQLTAMESRYQTLSKLQVKAPALFKQLAMLQLPPDRWLLETRIKVHAMTLFMRFCMFCTLLASLITGSLWESYQTTLSLLGPILLTPLVVRVLMPRYLPSSYNRTRIGYLSRFVYSPNFTQVFLFKIFLSLSLKYLYDPNGRFLLSAGQPLTTSTLFCANVMPLMWLCCLNTLFKAALGSYVPYVPGPTDIERLEQLVSRKSNLNVPIVLNYHLLQFVRENFKQPSTLNESEIEMKEVSSSPVLLSTHQSPPDSTALSSATCTHPVSSLSVGPASLKEQCDTIPLGVLKCEACSELIGQIHTHFTAQDLRYTVDRFDITYELTVCSLICFSDALANGHVVCDMIVH